MRFVAIQPPYAFSPEQADASVEAIVRDLDACDQSCDLILTPEYSNAPSAFTAETLAPFVRRHTPRLVEAALESVPFRTKPSLEELLESDALARSVVMKEGS